MPDIKYKSEILEAIDALRSSKNRPNLKRISNYVRKHHLVSPTECRSSLRKCLDSGDVFAVDFKGCTSFRNAAKSKHGRLKNSGNDTGTHSYLTNSIIKLLQGQEYKQNGLSVFGIKKIVGVGDSPQQQRQFVLSVIRRGIYDGTFIRLHNKNIALRKYFPDIGMEIAIPEFNLDLSDKNKGNYKLTRSDEQIINTEGESTIVVGRRKRSKKVVFDPSDNNLPKKKIKPTITITNSFSQDNMKRKHKTAVVRSKAKKLQILDNSALAKNNFLYSENNGPSVGGVCVVCLQEINQNVEESLIFCRDCIHKAHLNCIAIDDGMLRMRPDRTWQCPDCKTCVVCVETSDAGRLTVCSVCADPYHALCHAPRIRETYICSPIWQCCNCKPAGSDSVISEDSIFFNEEKPNPSCLENIPQRNFYDIKKEKPSSSILSKIKSQQYDYLQNLSSLNAENCEIELEKCSYYADYLKYKENHEQLHGDNISKHCIYECDRNVPLDPTIPDARSWTVDDVYHYFARLFPEDAIVFKREKIDGLALLLMNRNNIVEDLKLNLGVSLKMYRHVVLLQERRENTRRLYL